MNSNTPLISIIVPVYKVEKYLDCCVESILVQTYQNIEVILVDDGSPDDSGAMCDVWAQRDPRVRVIHKQNGGASSARNAGLDVAKGEYIGFVDSDDYIDKEMYSCMMKALENTHVKIACCKSMVVGEQDAKVFQGKEDSFTVKVFNTEETLDEIFAFRMGTSFWRRLFHASVFEGIRFPEGEINEEYPLLIPIAVKAEGTVFVERVLYYYRDRSDSVTGTVHTSLRTLRCVATNMKRMKEQIAQYEPGQLNAFPFFVAQNAFFMLLSIIKNHMVVEGELKELYGQYLAMAKEHKQAFLKEKNASPKSKLLYWLVIKGVYQKTRGIKIK